MKKKLLLVDDEKDIREILQLPLTDLGYHVFEAESGEEALRLFKDVQPPIVMTDIKMPGIDGIELLQKIKHENPETEVIMITGHGDMDLAVKSLKYEATDFITKPINVDALQIALQRARERIMTRRKLREYTENLERLVREKTELQSHLSSLGLMIASLSHGIKGLLTGLDGGIYLLDSGFTKKNKGQMQEGWEIVKSMIERIRKMMMDILFYARERELKLEHTDIRAFAEELVKELEPKMTSQKIKFVQHFDSDLGAFEVDRTYVYSALMNIIENAIDACSRQPTQKTPQIVFGIKTDKEHVCFEIADNGIGMDAETQEKIFTPFFSSKANKGTGLGLFVSNTIIQQHGGEIKVKSASGRGAVFQITIPKQGGS